MGPFIMNPEGVARFFARAGMNEGPFPEHYEPFETPLDANPLHPNNPQALNNPAARVFPDDRASFGKVASSRTWRRRTGSPSTSTTGPSMHG